MNEQDIFNGIRSDNQRIITDFYKGNMTEFLSFAKGYFSISRDEAKDFYQEAFYQMYFNIKNGRLKTLTCQLKTYLFAIGKNKIHNELRKNKRTLPQFNDDSWQSEIEELDRLEIETNYSNKLDIVYDEVYRLTDPCKKILVSFYFKRLSYYEIMREMPDYSVIDALKTQKYKCMKRLEKILKERFAILNLN
jgi:RNA polymerase sigma factor (sigma-70 family)